MGCGRLNPLSVQLVILPFISTSAKFTLSINVKEGLTWYPPAETIKFPDFVTPARYTGSGSEGKDDHDPIFPVVGSICAFLTSGKYTLPVVFPPNIIK